MNQDCFTPLQSGSCDEIVVNGKQILGQSCRFAEAPILGDRQNLLDRRNAEFRVSTAAQDGTNGISGFVLRNALAHALYGAGDIQSRYIRSTWRRRIFPLPLH